MMYAQDWLVPILWVLWLSVFVFLRPRGRSKPVVRAPHARWGILLQAIAYWILFGTGVPVFSQALPAWRIVAGTAMGVIGIVTAFAAIRHLGKQWRVDAGLNADHELVQTGPYKIMRHPIYGSMLQMLVMIILFIGRLPWWPIAAAFFITGIEIRVHAEDGLLRARFGEAFEEWKRRVPAYLPPLR